MTAPTTPVRRHLDAPEWVHFILVISTLSTLWCAGYIYLGTLTAGPVIAAGTLALAAWRTATYGKTVSHALFPVYIAALVILQLHVMEKWAGGYATTLPVLFPTAFAASPVVFNDAVFVAIFGLGAAALFLWASLGLYLGHPLGAYMAWALFVWSMVDGLTPFAVALASADYVPGMATGVFPVAMGAYGIVRLMRESRHHVAAA